MRTITCLRRSSAHYLFSVTFGKSSPLTGVSVELMHSLLAVWCSLTSLLLSCIPVIICKAHLGRWMFWCTKVRANLIRALRCRTINTQTFFDNMRDSLLFPSLYTVISQFLAWGKKVNFFPVPKWVPFVGLNNSTFLTSVLGAVGMSASRSGRINPKWRPLGHSRTWSISGDAWRKNFVLAEKRARFFSWKQITSVNCLDSPFKVVNLQPAAALNYVGSSFQAVQRMASHWVVSAYFSKVSNLQLVPSPSYRRSPFQSVQFMTVTLLSCAGLHYQAVQHKSNPFFELSPSTYPRCPTYN